MNKGLSNQKQLPYGSDSWMVWNRCHIFTFPSPRLEGQIVQMLQSFLDDKSENEWLGRCLGYKNILPGANRNINISKSGVGGCQQLHDRKLFYCILVRKPYCAVKYVSVRFQTLYTEAEQC